MTDKPWRDIMRESLADNLKTLSEAPMVLSFYTVSLPVCCFPLVHRLFAAFAKYVWPILRGAVVLIWTAAVAFIALIKVLFYPVGFALMWCIEWVILRVFDAVDLYTDFLKRRVK